MSDKCESSGCKNKAVVRCTNLDCSDRIMPLCIECALKECYCLACGQYYGGKEFTSLYGYCQTCAEEIEADDEEDDAD